MTSLILLTLLHADLPSQYGLGQPLAFRSTVDEAVRKVDLILGAGYPNRLRAGWLPSLPGYVPVYLVEGTNQPTHSLAYVPDKNRAIFISQEEVDQVGARFGGPSSGGLDIPAVDLLALVLLHEVAHIHYDDYEAAPSSSAFDEADLDRNVNTVKNREVRADLFAVTRLRAAYVGRKPMTFAAALEVVMCLGNVSFNLMGSRVLDHFGASVLNSPEVFGDGSYTHPNLELRFLLMNYRFNPSKTSRNLVDTFLAHRRRVRPTQPPRP